MTRAEKQRFKSDFPALDVDRVVVTGGATTKYNCIAWTVGVTNRWIWPGDSIGDFDKFYELRGYARSSNGPIAAWATGTGGSKMTHSCVSGPAHGSRWESKCGGDLRIQHGLDELTGPLYGKVIAFYNRDYKLLEEIEIYAGASQKMGTTKAYQKSCLNSAVKQIDGRTVTEFEARYASWEKTWRLPPVVFLSNPAAVKKCEEFEALIEMGERILPLVVQKLIDRKNFFALQLYDELQPETELLIRDQAARFQGEQKRAEQTVERWISGL